MRRPEIPARDLRLPDHRTLRYAGAAPFVPGGHRYEARGGLVVIASDDATPHGLLRHVSLSYSYKNPLWTEIRAVRDLFFPATVDAMMVLPREADYVNVHEHTFHLWQTPAPWGIQ